MGEVIHIHVWEHTVRTVLRVVNMSGILNLLGDGRDTLRSVYLIRV